MQKFHKWGSTYIQSGSMRARVPVRTEHIRDFMIKVCHFKIPGLPFKELNMEARLPGIFGIRDVVSYKVKIWAEENYMKSWVNTTRNRSF